MDYDQQLVASGSTEATPLQFVQKSPEVIKQQDGSSSKNPCKPWRKLKSNMLLPTFQVDENEEQKVAGD